ncbi:MAG: hypothetical protein WB689_23950 [Xanthobacteraceae bacterium]
MSFDLTDLHTLIVRAHDRHKVPIGKAMRVIMQAAANRKFPLYKPDGSPFKLRRVDRKWLLDHAAIAEHQNAFRWWDKRPWSALKSVQVSEPKFWKWFDGEFGAPETTVAAMAAQTSTAMAPAKAKASLGAKSQGIEGAIEALWSGNIPNGLSAKERNTKIINYLVANGLSVPTSPERAIQRVLKARRQATK